MSNKPEYMRLNKYLSNSGISNRKQADELIKKGFVKINGKVVKEMGVQVSTNDIVHFKDELLEWPYKPFYILLNKPKDCITEKKPDQEQKSVFDFINPEEAKGLFAFEAMKENDLGLLIISNDKRLAKLLTDPKVKIKKIYLLELDKDLSDEDFNTLSKGIKIDGKIVEVKEIAFPNEMDKSKIGIELRDNRSKIVVEILKELNYTVLKSDLTLIGNLTKKDLPRSKWRFLTEKELRGLKRIIST